MLGNRLGTTILLIDTNKDDEDDEDYEGDEDEEEGGEEEEGEEEEFGILKVTKGDSCLPCYLIEQAYMHLNFWPFY